MNVYVCQSQERLLKAAWKRKNVNEIETPKEYKEKMKRKKNRGLVWKAAAWAVQERDR